MDRIDDITADQDFDGSGHRGFRDGDPTAGTIATALRALFANNVQEEICNVIENAGITLSSSDMSQMLQSLAYFAGHRIVRLRGYDDDGTVFPTLILQRSNGTRETPANVKSGDTIGEIWFAGRDDTGVFPPVAALKCVATGDFEEGTPSVFPAKFVIQTSINDDGNLNDVVIIDGTDVSLAPLSAPTCIRPIQGAVWGDGMTIDLRADGDQAAVAASTSNSHHAYWSAPICVPEGDTINNIDFLLSDLGGGWGSATLEISLRRKFYGDWTEATISTATPTLSTGENSYTLTPSYTVEAGASVRVLMKITGGSGWTSGASLYSVTVNRTTRSLAKNVSY